jgi:hypothetical protein
MKYRKYPNWVILTNKEIPFPYKAAAAVVAAEEHTRELE